MKNELMKVLENYIEKISENAGYWSILREDMADLEECAQMQGSILKIKNPSYLERIHRKFEKLHQKGMDGIHAVAVLQEILTDVKSMMQSENIVEDEVCHTDLGNDGYIFLGDEFRKFMSKIQRGENFALMGYGEEEQAILGKWSSLENDAADVPEGRTTLEDGILDAMALSSDRVYYGIPCPCCDKRGYYWYASRVGDSRKITFARLWDWGGFREDFLKLRRDAVVIGNGCLEGRQMGNLNILKCYRVADDRRKFWKDGCFHMLEEIQRDFGDRNDLFYVVSAGELSGPIIASLYRNNPDNCYVDFGDSLQTLWEVAGSTFQTEQGGGEERNCWMYHPERVRFDVTAVCTLYKKPEALLHQLEAIERQTLKPKEIVLFQDGIDDSCELRISEEVRERFGNVRIADRNYGVWERFRFAMEVETCYVCLFDDDTVPGSRWLENCHYYMQFQEGIYGTNGILLTEPEKYPIEGYFMVGWKEPAPNLVEVDFVGHSWFVKREYLGYMFENTEAYQKLKYVGEDMCLSVKAKEHGIRTFVPPHPIGNMDLWGSIPQWGKKYGLSPEAVSANSAHQITMGRAVEMFRQNGWKTLIEDEPEKVQFAIDNIQCE